jgi:hypothetical protein
MSDENKTHNNRQQDTSSIANTARPRYQEFTAKPMAGRLLTETVQPTGEVVVTANLEIPVLISGVAPQQTGPQIGTQASAGQTDK